MFFLCHQSVHIRMYNIHIYIYTYTYLIDLLWWAEGCGEGDAPPTLPFHRISKVACGF